MTAINTSERIVIMGAGPTGLGAAWRLHELGHSNWTLLDRSPRAGGLSLSYLDEKGFTWDLGGHVLFSHYEYFDRLMDHLLGNQWVDHVRESWVWMRDQFIPYPLQNNIRHLPFVEAAHAYLGLLHTISGGAHAKAPENFDEWIVRYLGEGLANSFMRPYNFKVWAYPPEDLSAHWLGERVATVDIKKLTKNILLRKDELSWGPNSKFRFPLHGGTGAIWEALYRKLPAANCRLNCEVTELDSRSKTLQLSGGETLAYDRLISTIPLTDLLTRTKGLPPELGGLPSQFRYSSSHIVGIGMSGQPSEKLRTKNWMYFPEDNSPFYRVTVFSNYSPNNVPRPLETWSLLCEVSESAKKPVDSSRVIDSVVQGLLNTGLIKSAETIISRWHKRLEHGYPTPFLGRDGLLNQIQPQLQTCQIYSRGRFGAWKYEVSNQDHSLMQGVEVVDSILFGEREITVESPNTVNSTKQSLPKNLGVIGARKT